VPPAIQGALSRVPERATISAPMGDGQVP
jgi:hypothetical protein